MISRFSRFFRRQAPAVRVTHYSPAEYLRGRYDGSAYVRVELPSTSSPESPHVSSAMAERPEIRAADGPAACVHAGPSPHPRRSPFCADGPAAPCTPGAAGTAFDAWAAHYGDYGNSNVND